MTSGTSHEQPEGVRFSRAGDTIVAEWEGLGRLRANADGSEAEFLRAEGANPSAVDRHRRIVDALLRHLRGQLTFHASAVARDDVAVAFLGDQGAGKSTLAAAFGRRGLTSFVADDCLPVELLDDGAYVEPSGETHWLDATARAALSLSANDPSAAKTSYSPSSRRTDPTRLVAAVKLAFDDASSPRLCRLCGRDGFLLLEESVFRLPLFDDEILARDLDGLSRFAQCVPMFTLTRPRSFLAMNECVDMLTQLFERRP